MDWIGRACTRGFKTFCHKESVFSLHFSLSYYHTFMLRSIAYIIFLCTGIFSIFLVLLFLRSQSWQSDRIISDNPWKEVVIGGSSMHNLEKHYTFSKSSQEDIFWAFIFNFPVKIQQSKRIKMYVFENDYSLIRRNLLLLSNFYNFTDTTDFFGRTMFLNDKSWDGSVVRFLTEIDGRAVGFEVLRDEYATLKSLLLK